jgi:hypothetical protein
MKTIIILLLILITNYSMYSQTAVISDNPAYTGDNSAALDVNSSSKGMLVPRVTQAQRTSISSPAQGLLVFQTDGTPGFYYFDVSWKTVGGASAPDGSETIINVTAPLTITGNGTTATKYSIGYTTLTVTQSSRAFLSPVAGQIIYCSNCGQYGEVQVYNGSGSWVNLSGGSAASPLALGDTYQGGKVAYILGSGDPGYVAGQTHGFIATTSDQSYGITWGCSGTDLAGVTGTDLGTGLQNTEDFVKVCQTAGTPARICNDLVSGGYSDWFLPSQEEMRWVVGSKTYIGGINSSVGYWSSSEISDANAIRILATGGTSTSVPKTESHNVRCIRAF